jgi:hypothetical protein
MKCMKLTTLSLFHGHCHINYIPLYFSDFCHFLHVLDCAVEILQFPHNSKKKKKPKCYILWINNYVLIHRICMTTEVTSLLYTGIYNYRARSGEYIDCGKSIIQSIFYHTYISSLPQHIMKSIPREMCSHP